MYIGLCQQKHKKMIKVRKIAAIIVTALAILMTVFSGVMKLSGGDEMVKTLSAMGVANYVILLGCMEIVFAALFAIPRTMKLGFILLSCYFAGALATELSHGTPLNALTPIILVWVAAFLRDSSVFFPASVETAK